MTANTPDPNTDDAVPASGVSTWWRLTTKDIVALLPFVLPLASVLLCLLIFWTFTLFLWPLEATSRQLTVLELRDQNERLQIDHPRIVLADDKPTLIHVTWFYPTGITETLRLTGTTSPEFAFISPIPTTITETSKLTSTLSPESQFSLSPLYPIAVTPALSPTASGQVLATFTVINARLVSWPLTQQGYLQINTSTGEQFALSLPVESTLRASFQALASSEIGERSPMFLLVAALFSGMGFLYIQYPKYQDERNKREDADRAAAQKQIEDFRRFLREGKVENATKVLMRLKDSDLSRYVAVDIMQAQILVSLARDMKIPQSGIGSLASHWPAEAAYALVLALKTVHSSQDTTKQSLEVELRRAVRTFPIQLLTDKQIREVQEGFSPVSDVELQRLDWPKTPNQPPTVTGPFPYDRAENEVLYLFSKQPFFWEDHELYKSLVQSLVTELIYGAPGVGKTAWTLALGEYNRSEKDAKRHFSCVVSGTPAIFDIQSTFIHRLWLVVREHPTRLTRLRSAQIELLAGLCATHLGKNFILSEIESCRLKEQEWIKNAGDSRVQEVLVSNAQIQFLRLIRAVKLSSSSNPKSIEWLHALLHCVQALGFGGLRLVVDLAELGGLEWFSDFRRTELQSWTARGLHVKIFMPDTVAAVLGISETSELPEGVGACYELHWRGGGNNQPLKEMVDWRFQSIGENRQACISDEVLLTLIKMSGPNPRCFIRLWKYIMSNRPTGKITEADVAGARGKVKCP